MMEDERASILDEQWRAYEHEILREVPNSHVEYTRLVLKVKLRGHRVRELTIAEGMGQILALLGMTAILSRVRQMFSSIAREGLGESEEEGEQNEANNNR